MATDAPLKSKLVESIFFNYFGTIAAALGPLLALPVYLGVLGKAQWGMMSVVMTVMALLIMVDGGLSQVLVREFALRSREHGQQSQPVRSLLASCQALYGALAVALALALAMSSGWIARHWLNLTADIHSQEATQLLMTSALLVGTQLFAALPRSLLLAVDLHRPLNVSIAIGHVFRYGVGAGVVWLWHSLQWLLVWYVIVAMAEGAVRYAMAWRAVGTHGWRGSASWPEIRHLLPGAVKMSLAVVLSGLTTQMDKLILTKMVTLDQVGIYAIASSAALGLLSLTYPMIQAVFPTLLAVHGNKSQIRKIFLTWLTLGVAGAALTMALYIWLGHAVLNLWLRNDEIAVAVYPVLLVLLIGTLLNVIYQVGYVGWMLEANYRMPLIISICSVVLTALLTPVLVRHEGIMGAAAGWLLINALGLLLSLSWFRKIV
ncbi:Polysaccharide biosynthesis protein [Variovorax sp. SRS16]|nr:Polysaccharide biosynthesis protein [Variovorax sp. SRS16]